MAELSDILATEEAIRAQVPGSAPPQWAMWLPKSRLLIPSGGPLRLQTVACEADWAAMLAARIEIERALGIVDPRQVAAMIAGIRRLTTALGGQWYLAHLSGEVVGGIGLIPFTLGGQRIGRLQDIDILPAHQGQGLGRQLIEAICAVAAAQQLDGLCLMARSDDWPKDWYRRLGFARLAHPPQT